MPKLQLVLQLLWLLVDDPTNCQQHTVATSIPYDELDSVFAYVWKLNISLVSGSEDEFLSGDWLWHFSHDLWMNHRPWFIMAMPLDLKCYFHLSMGFLHTLIIKMYGYIFSHTVYYTCSSLQIADCCIFIIFCLEIDCQPQSVPKFCWLHIWIGYIPVSHTDTFYLQW